MTGDDITRVIPLHWKLLMSALVLTPLVTMTAIRTRTLHSIRSTEIGLMRAERPLLMVMSHAICGGMSRISIYLIH
jgi:hypothetical protein